jgi:glycosyltransferase involved in cell wall biosynthesis
MALAEAMAVGLPCIGYVGDAHQDMLTPGETGVLAGSVAEIAQCTLGLMRDKALRHLLAAQAFMAGRGD